MRELFAELRIHCPECKHKPPIWYEGPRGGINVNIFCGNCGQGYNVAEMVGVAEKIHKDEKYIHPE
jgi:hypothetical protein